MEVMVPICRRRQRGAHLPAGVLAVHLAGNASLATHPTPTLHPANPVCPCNTRTPSSLACKPLPRHAALRPHLGDANAQARVRHHCGRGVGQAVAGEVEAGVPAGPGPHHRPALSARTLCCAVCTVAHSQVAPLARPAATSQQRRSWGGGAVTTWPHPPTIIHKRTQRPPPLRDLTPRQCPQR